MITNRRTRAGVVAGLGALLAVAPLGVAAPGQAATEMSRIVATLVDPAGAPVAKACVSVAYTGRKACSGADGVATLTLPVSPSRRTIVAWTPSGSRGAVSTQVDGSGAVAVTLTLAPSAVLRGTIVDETGAPRVGVCPTAALPDDPYAPTLARQKGTCTDAKGRWAIRGLAAGSYTVYAPAVEGFPWSYAPGLGAPSTTYAVTAGQVRTLTWTSGGAATVSGTVTLPDGKPAVAVLVSLAGVPDLSMPPMTDAWTARTDSQGKYRITGLAHVVKPLVAYDYPASFAFTYTGGATDSASATPVDVPWGGSVTADIRTKPEAKLQVTLAGVPAAASQANVQAWTLSGDRSGWEQGMSAPGGTFDLRGVAAGTVKLSATVYSPEGVPTTFWYAGAPDAASATPVKVSTTKATSLTWTLPTE
ncbi:MAG: carboxypeptidase-like regulatory domain-containing protein [Kineosporiaceae bacterium]